MADPKKWTEKYPQGTKEGDEEAKFFKALARSPKWEWRSTGAIVKDTGLPKERVEEIINKYTKMNPPLVYAHPKNEDHWGYWERVPHMVPKDEKDLSKQDKDSRVDKHLSGEDRVDAWDGDGDSVSADKTQCWAAVCGVGRGNVPSILDILGEPEVEVELANRLFEEAAVVDDEGWNLDL